MVTTRGRAMGTQPKARPLPAKLSKAEKAAKAAQLKAEREEKKAEKAAVKALNDAKKAAAKAEKDAIKAAAKAEKEANKAAAKAAARAGKAADAKSTPKGTKRTASKMNGTKTTKTTKTVKKAKATRASTNQYDIDEDEDDEDEESEEENYEPQAKRRKVGTRAPPDLRVEMGPPKAKRPALKIGEWVYIKEAFLPEGIENEDNRPLPQIYIGSAAPQPRWVITQTQSIKRPASNAKSSGPDGTRDFGSLQWTFEEGGFKKWTGLEYPALYELAYKCLEYTLIDTEVREQIYGSLAHPAGPLPKAVTVGDKWYPALPPVPITRHFSSGSEQTSRKSSDTAFYFRNYERPNMAVRVEEKRVAKPYPHAVTTHIYNRATSEAWPTAPRSASPDAESERGSEQGGEGSQSSESRRSSVTRNSSLELNPEGTYSEPTTPVPLGNDEKISRIGEYKRA
jgi:chemotaxis protein histidine kinase CheA